MPRIFGRTTFEIQFIASLQHVNPRAGKTRGHCVRERQATPAFLSFLYRTLVRPGYRMRVAAGHQVEPATLFRIPQEYLVCGAIAGLRAAMERMESEEPAIDSLGARGVGFCGIRAWRLRPGAEGRSGPSRPAGA
jgi:hypothetical protein